MKPSRPHPRALRRSEFEVVEQRIVLSVNPVPAYLTGAGDLAPLATTTQTQLVGSDITGLDHVRTAYGFTGRGQTVAVIDTGIAYDSAALGGGYGTGYRVVGGYDFTGEHPGNPFDYGPNGSHGTHVAGIIGSSDTLYPGVAPGVDLVALRVFDASGGCSFDRVDQALKWVDTHRNSFANPITTVNLSLGIDQNTSAPQQYTMLEADLAKLQADGIFVDASAGNNFSAYLLPGLSYPAASPYVIPVASVDPNGTLSAFSQRDARVIAAPGRSIMSTVPDYVGDHNGRDDDFARFSGTSMAAAEVSGAAVILRQAYQYVGVNNVTSQQLYQEMYNTADTFRDAATGLNIHRLNLGRAVDDVIASKPAAKLAGTLGAYDPSRGLFTLNTSSGTVSFVFGPHNSSTVPLMGDWNGDGVATVGVYDPTTATFYLRNSNTAGQADITFSFGTRNTNWIPIVGDWNGDRVWSVGLYDPTAQTFYLKNTNASRPADVVFSLRGGNSTWLPVAGDFNGDGRTDLALYDPAKATLYTKNTTVTGRYDASYNLGSKYAGWLPVAADWNADGTATIGLFNPTTGSFVLENNYTNSGTDTTATIAGSAKTWRPIVGNWTSAVKSVVRTAGVTTAAIHTASLAVADSQPAATPALLPATIAGGQPTAAAAPPLPSSSADSAFGIPHAAFPAAAPLPFAPLNSVAGSPQSASAAFDSTFHFAQSEFQPDSPALAARFAAMSVGLASASDLFPPTHDRATTAWLSAQAVDAVDLPDVLAGHLADRALDWEETDMARQIIRSHPMTVVEQALASGAADREITYPDPTAADGNGDPAEQDA